MDELADSVYRELETTRGFTLLHHRYIDETATHFATYSHMERSVELLNFL